MMGRFLGMLKRKSRKVFVSVIVHITVYNGWLVTLDIKFVISNLLIKGAARNFHLSGRSSKGHCVESSNLFLAILFL